MAKKLTPGQRSTARMTGIAGGDAIPDFPPRISRRGKPVISRGGVTRKISPFKKL